MSTATVGYWNGPKIKKARQALGLTQGQLAAMIGTRQQQVNAWENGYWTPKSAYQILLTMAFGRLRGTMEDML